jgi:hypothetical protein
MSRDISVFSPAPTFRPVLLWNFCLRSPFASSVKKVSVLGIRIGVKLQDLIELIVRYDEEAGALGLDPGYTLSRSSSFPSSLRRTSSSSWMADFFSWYVSSE